MHPGLAALIESASRIPQVGLNAATAYRNRAAALLQHVDAKLAAMPDIDERIGGNPREVMFENHAHHAAFMTTVMTLGKYELLARTMVWVYRARSAHGFRYDYFVAELHAWIDAVQTYLLEPTAGEITRVYRWMLVHHEAVIELAESAELDTLEADMGWLETKTHFLHALLDGDQERCLTLANEVVKTRYDLIQLYDHVIQPAMYDVGTLWERGAIGVAEEHLATSIVGRVMAFMSAMLEVSPNSPGTAVLTSAPKESHEIGVRMISDILEQDGWSTRFLGADTPATEVMKLLHKIHPRLLAVSVTMPYNILKARELITAVKANHELADTLVMVGGHAFLETEGLWESTGADLFAPDVAHARQALLERAVG